VNRFVRTGATVAVCLVLSSCGDDPGDETAQAACRAYGDAASGATIGPAVRTTAMERAQRAGEANGAYAAIAGDMDDAWKRADAMATAHNGGGQVSAHELDAYFAADRRVRQDCADAGADLGPLEP
jgi:hypothetical protein